MSKKRKYARMNGMKQLSQLSGFGLSFIIALLLAFVLVIVFGGFQVLEGQMGPGVLIGFLLYIQRFFRPVFELTRPRRNCQ